MPVCLNGIHDQIDSNKGLLKMVNGEGYEEKAYRWDFDFSRIFELLQ